AADFKFRRQRRDLDVVILDRLSFSADEYLCLRSIGNARIIEYWKGPRLAGHTIKSNLQNITTYGNEPEDVPALIVCIGCIPMASIFLIVCFHHKDFCLCHWQSLRIQHTTTHLCARFKRKTYLGEAPVSHSYFAVRTAQAQPGRRNRFDRIFSGGYRINA